MFPLSHQVTYLVNIQVRRFNVNYISYGINNRLFVLGAQVKVAHIILIDDRRYINFRCSFAMNIEFPIKRTAIYPCPIVTNTTSM